MKPSNTDLTESQPFTQAQVDELFAKLKQALGDFSVLNDLIFKHLFGEPGKAEKRLMSFLNAVRKQMQQPLITEVTIESSTNYPTNSNDKITFLDIKAKDCNGCQYNVEVQLIDRRHFVRRVVYYNSKMHYTQLDKGDDYGKIRPTISIVLTDFLLFEELPGLFQLFRITSETNPEYVLTDDIQYVFIQFGGVLTEQMLTGLVPELADWIRFFNFKRIDEATMKKVLFANPMVASTSNVLTEFVSDKKTRDVIEDMEMHRRDYAWAMQCERNEGQAEGEARGKAEEVANKVVRLLEHRFGNVSHSLNEALHKISDLDKLNKLFDFALDCKALEDFEAKL